MDTTDCSTALVVITGRGYTGFEDYHGEEMTREDSKGPLQTVSLRAAIRDNADYRGHPAGVLTEDELASMHRQVETALATTNGDTGACEITARQLALLLNAATGSLQAS